MDTLLIAVTAIALALAAGMAIAVVKLVGDDRRRSEARVAALTAMSETPVSRPQRSADIAPEPAVTRRLPPARTTAPRADTPRLDDLEIRRAEQVVPGLADLFADRNQPSPWGRRVAVIGALAVVAAAIGFAIASSDDKPAPAPARATLQTPAAAEPVPLELMSLRHLQQAQSLTVTGLVQNPRTGAPLSHVVVTAFAFGPDGTFLSSSRAPLDFTTLAPGGESPFVVTVPVTGVVSRYRIGFRGEDGGVIAHVDKRVPESLAALAGPKDRP
jgi:hypothetical protein